MKMDDPEDPQVDKILAYSKLPFEERRKQVSEWREELSQVEYEMDQLSEQLAIKQRQADFLRRKIGFSTWTEIKDDIHRVVDVVKDNYVYQKTSQAASSLYGSLSERLANVFH